MTRRVYSVFFWLTVGGPLVALFELVHPKLDLPAVIAAGVAFVIGVVGALWSWPKVRPIHPDISR